MEFHLGVSYSFFFSLEMVDMSSRNFSIKVDFGVWAVFGLFKVINRFVKVFSRYFRYKKQVKIEFF